jgi:hypothetical protein
VLPKAPLGHQKRGGLVKITRNNWKPRLFILRFPVVSRDFDEPAAFLVPAAFLAALGSRAPPRKGRFGVHEAHNVLTILRMKTQEREIE